MRYTLIGQCDNDSKLVNYTKKAMRICGLKDKIPQMCKEATSGDHNHLIYVCDCYIQMCNDMVEPAPLEEGILDNIRDKVTNIMAQAGVKNADKALDRAQKEYGKIAQEIQNLENQRAARLEADATADTQDIDDALKAKKTELQNQINKIGQEYKKQQSNKDILDTQKEQSAVDKEKDPIKKKTLIIQQGAQYNNKPEMQRALAELNSAQQETQQINNEIQDIEKSITKAQAAGAQASTTEEKIKIKQEERNSQNDKVNYERRALAALDREIRALQKQQEMEANQQSVENEEEVETEALHNKPLFDALLEADKAQSRTKRGK